ncbi:MAG: PfkB family carbohydrate kinase [Flavobacteriales bacterium]|nr:PfkB family carbohydrate kinase [Flavobacteriales bacterium]
MNTPTTPSPFVDAAHRATVQDALRKAEQLKVLVVGDVMVDAYLLGQVERISPEAPVPILRTEKREQRPGGAANVALNLVALGAQCALIGTIGHDSEGENLLGLLESAGIDASGLVALDSRPTTSKTRVMSGGQHLLRVDRETTDDLSASDSAAVLERINTLLDRGGFHALVLEDYDKGVLTPAVIEGGIAAARRHGIPVAVDPKLRHFNSYCGVDLFKPNLLELNEGLGLRARGDVPAEIDRALDALIDKLAPAATLLTLSEHGVRFRSAAKDATSGHWPAHARDIVDVSGAGDTVIAVATVLLAQGVSLNLVAATANMAGGLVCEKPGVVPVDPAALHQEIERGSAALQSA